MDENIKPLIRIMNVDIDGQKGIYFGLGRIPGVGSSFSNVICSVLELDKFRKIGTLNLEELKKIENVISEPKKHNIPEWLLNRRKDHDSGEDLHIATSTLKLTKEMDVKKLKKIKSYRGLRHQAGLPLRGQRTRGNFRRGKTIGVSKKKGKSGRN